LLLITIIAYFCFILFLFLLFGLLIPGDRIGNIYHTELKDVISIIIFLFLFFWYLFYDNYGQLS